MSLRDVSIICLLCSLGWELSAAESGPSLIDSEAWAASTDQRLYITLDDATFQGDPADGKHKDVVLVVQRTNGEWLPSVAVMPQGLNRGQSSGRIVEGAGSHMAFTVDANIGSDQWVPGDPQARFSIVLEEGEDGLSGSYSGTFRATDVSGTAKVAVQRSGWIGGADNPDGRAVSLQMGSQLGGWNRAKWVNLLLPELVDASAYDGLEISIATDQPRHDAALDVGVMEADGSWYSIRNAIPLSAATHTARVHFDDLRIAEFLFNDRGTWAGTDGNFDQDPFLDRDRLARVAIGVVNAHGVGQVSFTITDVRLAAWDEEGAEGDAPVAVQVTGETLSINGTEEIPAGLFGWHVAGGRWDDLAVLRPGSIRTARAMGFPGQAMIGPRPDIGIEYVVSGHYDRKQMLPQMDGMRNWRERAADGGRMIGEAAAPHGELAVMEFWNEPYLDIGRMFERKLAKELTPPEGTQAGDPVVWRGRTLESMEWTAVDGALTPRDPSRFSYWSGRQTEIFYTELLQETARAAREHAPDMQIIGGFGFRWHEDDWQSWDILHKPMIDATIELIDGVCEHHYQGLPEAIPASYEVLAAYTTTRFDKLLYGVNTEANDLWDAPARGNVAASDQAAGAFTSRRRMIYNTRDLLYTIIQTPDKALARATHAQWSGSRDRRVAVDQPITYDRNRQVRVDSFALVRETVVATPDGERGITAEVGEQLLVIDYQLASSERRNRAFRPNEGRLHLVVDGQRQHLSVAGRSHTRQHRSGRPEVEIPGNASVTGQRIVFRVPADLDDEAILQWQPRTKHGQRFHLQGPFAPWKVSPWAHIGINEGEYHAYYALRNLRGRLVASESSDERIWVVSSIDGQTGQLVTVVWNDDWRSRSVDLTLSAPLGATFGAGTRELLFHRADGSVGLAQEPQLATGGELVTSLEIPPAHAVVISLPLTGEIAETADRTRQQFYAGSPDDETGGVLRRLVPGEQESLPLPAAMREALAGAQRAWLRLVVEGVNEGEAWVEIGDQRLTLPRRLTQHNSPSILEIPIDVSMLAGVDRLTIGSNSPEVGDGWLCAMASVVIEHH